ncbi:uncharacterized protein LOC126774770 [Nymphalis io]|uniref:uncharacterized protein LOC126774770 n=1 Tax=Inachis io TaxID=171585 RepID=UPI0021684C1C|nr:uncharacterized protein LOC126774770 [Nymphalis io]
MAFKTVCLLLVLAVAAYAYPQNYAHNGGFVDDPGFSNGQGQGGFPTQGNGYDSGYSGQRQGGFPSQGGFNSDHGFGNGQGQGGFAHQGGYRQRHRGGYQENGY